MFYGSLHCLVTPDQFIVGMNEMSPKYFCIMKKKMGVQT